MNKIIGYFVLVVITFGALGFALNWFGDATQTVHKEYDPSAMLKKYEWFKNQSERILKMDKDIDNIRISRNSVKTQFEQDNGSDHTKWDMIVKVSYQDKLNLQEQMLLATVSQRNGIVADYNAQSSKFNWEPFKSKTDLPPVSFESIK